ncbi:hypothetical protein SAMN05444274_101604 [Mariniphaga anaerophila]|uniref:Uncharacterized protein n=1 Tax=Mariniphaga anaerophila TaxID=1484053 RepID=A0A1M4U879_9BACT|nr:hypothetical protein [Mariniphaga anaerophila]SHE52874.1 hypothetical protein SAMN05444274_101604 [Mariniphaga anaerophila]
MRSDNTNFVYNNSDRGAIGWEMYAEFLDIINNMNNAESIFEIQYKEGKSDGFSNEFFYIFLPRVNDVSVVAPWVSANTNGGWKGMNSAAPDLINCFEESGFFVNFGESS